MPVKGERVSKYQGVAPKTDGSGLWRAQIQLSLGTYASEEDAARIYVEAEKRFRALALGLRREMGDLLGEDVGVRTLFGEES